MKIIIYESGPDTAYFFRLKSNFQQAIPMSQ